jgi:hypothetical protein
LFLPPDASDHPDANDDARLLSGDQPATAPALSAARKNFIPQSRNFR